MKLGLLRDLLESIHFRHLDIHESCDRRCFCSEFTAEDVAAASLYRRVHIAYKQFRSSRGFSIDTRGKSGDIGIAVTGRQK